MALTLRRVSADGTVEDQLEGEVIVGRATDCTICLPGLLVALKHARLTSLSGSRIKLESLCPMGVEVNGLPGVQSAELQPGDVMRIGGSPQQIAARLAEFGDAGADEVILVLNPITEASIRFLGEVLAT